MKHNNSFGFAWSGQTKKDCQIHYCDNVSMKTDNAAIASWRQRYRPHLRRITDFGNLCQIKRIE